MKTCYGTTPSGHLCYNVDLATRKIRVWLLVLLNERAYII